LVLLATLLPVAIYLSILGWVNRRPRGMLVSGPWDFVGVLFAASGLLLLGIPALLSSLCRTELWRDFWLMAKWIETPVEEMLELGRVLLFGLYFLFVVAGATLLLWRRRAMTCVYNVHPSLVERILRKVFETRQLPFVQMGNVLVVDPDMPSNAAVVGEEETTPFVPVTPLEEAVRLEIDASAQMSYVTMWWSPADSLLRKELESQLRRSLAREEAQRSVVGDWLILSSSVLFFALLLGAGVLALLRLMRG
jgi:hypothetical protein